MRSDIALSKISKLIEGGIGRRTFMEAVLRKMQLIRIEFG
jgi:hypothetical protein